MIVVMKFLAIPEHLISKLYLVLLYCSLSLLSVVLRCELSMTFIIHAKRKLVRERRNALLFLSFPS